MTHYRFAGKGPGIPGLPHEISVEEAAEQGLSELLQAAIENGNYAPTDEAGPAHESAAVDANDPAGGEENAPPLSSVRSGRANKRRSNNSEVEP